MNGFQEQQLFTGAAQSQGFAPDQVADPTIGLRENYEVANLNTQRFVEASRQQNEQKLAKEVEYYNFIGDLVPKAKEYGQKLAMAYLNSQAVQAQDDAIKLGELANFGISPEEQVGFNAIQDQATQEGIVANNAAYDAHLKGAPTEAVNYLKSLPRYRQLYATQYWVQQKGTEYAEFHRNFLLRDTVYTDPRDGTKFTARQVGGDRVRAGIVDTASRQSHLVEQVGISQTFNPNKVLMRPYYQSVAKQSQSYFGQVKEVGDVQESTNIKASAIQAFVSNKQFSHLIAANSGLRVNQNGKYKTLTRGEAISEAYDDVVNLYKGGYINRIQAESILKQEVAHAKGKTYGEFYTERSADFIDELNKVDSNRRKAKNLEKADTKEQLNSYLVDYITNSWDGNPDSLREAVQQTVTIAQQNGIYDYTGAVATPHITNANRRVKRDMYIDTFTRAQKDRTLTVAELMKADVPQDIRQQFLPAAREQDAIRARIPPEEDVKSDFTSALRIALGDSSLDVSMLGLRSARFAAMRRYRQLVGQLSQGKSAEDAHEEAKQRVEAEIAEGKGVFARVDWKDKPAGTKATSYWPAFTPNPNLSESDIFDSKKVKEEYNKDNTLADRAPLVPVPVLEGVAAQIRAGVPVDVPQIYYDLGQGNPTELLNRNLAAINRPERMVPTPANIIQGKTSDPGLKRLAQNARSVFDQQRVQAADAGATQDPAFMNPRVVQYVSGDPAIRGINTGRIIYDERGHGGANYHNHYEFETPQQALQAIAKFKAAGFRVTSYLRDNSRGHKAGVAVDVAPPLDLPYTDEAEREWSARANAVIGFDPLEGIK